MSSIKDLKIGAHVAISYQKRLCQETDANGRSTHRQTSFSEKTSSLRAVVSFVLDQPDEGNIVAGLSGVHRILFEDKDGLFLRQDMNDKWGDKVLAISLS